MVAYDEIETNETDTHSENESSFEWELRVMVVSAVWMLPGILLGLLVRLFVFDGGPAEFWLLGGGMIGAIAGGMLEAGHWPL